jgi:hypothetical protein
VALLLIVTLHAHDTVFVLHSPVLVADRAQELYTTSVISSDQAQIHTSTTPSERGPSSDASAVIVQLSICLLTMVEADMLSEAA